MTSPEMQKPDCWCELSDLIPFTEEYFRCQHCDTLISQTQPESPAAFYGPDYWTSRQTEILGHPDIYQRAREDLSSRVIYWLKTLLNYKKPPGATLEIGSGHGGFSALLQWAGFQVIGLEPHAWVSQFAQSTFNIPTLTGPLTEQLLEPDSFDVIILLDVLEHLPNPVETLQSCRKFLKSDGILLIQTPCVPSKTAVTDLERDQNPILKMLLPLEHLYLYSQGGLQKLLTETGFPSTTFEAALFPYDMFLVATATQLKQPVNTGPAKTLLKTPNGRFVLALLDLYQKWQVNESSKNSWLKQIDLLTAKIQEVEADRAARLIQVQTLTEQLQKSETDRQARLDQVYELSAKLNLAEADRTARIEQIVTLTDQLKTAETDRQARLKQVQELTGLLQESETDRQTRLDQIQSLTQQLQGVEEQRTAHLSQIEELTSWLAEAEQDRAERLVQIKQLTGWLETAEADRAARLEQVNKLTELLAESETDRAARLEQIKTLTATLNNLENQSTDSA